jgi:hypothetical protein
MTYPADMKNRATELYIKYGHVPTVYKQIKEEYQGKLIPKEITIRKWVENGYLEEYQKSLHTDVMVKARTQEMEKLVTRQEEQKGNYRKLINKADEKLFGDEKLEFTNAMDAARAMDMGIQGERKISTEQLNLQFVEDIFNAVFNVIRDEDLRRDIAMELRKILSKHNDGHY